MHSLLLENKQNPTERGSPSPLGKDSPSLTAGGDSQPPQGALGCGQRGHLLVEAQPGKLLGRIVGFQLHRGHHTHVRLAHLEKWQ